MRTPLNAANLQKDLNDICNISKDRWLQTSSNLELISQRFQDEVNPQIMQLFEQYVQAYPGYTGVGDWRVGAFLYASPGGVYHTPNDEMKRFIDHVKLAETKPLKSYEIPMSDLCTYVVFAHSCAEAIEIMCAERPDLTIQMPKSIVEKDIPTKPGIFLVKQQIIL